MREKLIFIKNTNNSVFLLFREKDNDLNTIPRIASGLVDWQLIYKITFQMRVLRELKFDKRFVICTARNFEIDGASTIVGFSTSV